MSLISVLAQSEGGFGIVGPMLFVGIPAIVVIFFLVFLSSRYKRCPSNRILVVYGKTGKTTASKCIHGGGLLVWPIIQDYSYLSLEPMTLDIELAGALSLKNIRVSAPSTFTVAISTDPNIMQVAAERLLGLRDNDIAATARDIILGQMRLVIAMLSIEEINQDREKFLDLINKYCAGELSKIGLDVINVNIRDITDESGYIEALGKKAAAEAINTARVEVAEAEREGSIGEAKARREMDIQVAQQLAQAEAGRKEAERDQRIAVAQLEAQGVAGEARSAREREVAIAEQRARANEGKKQADTEQRVKVADFEANAIEGENRSKADIAAYQATLNEREAEAKRRGEVAKAQAERDVLIAEREREQARLEKEQIVLQEIEKQKIRIDAEADAERIRQIAQGEADGVLAKYLAEAEGVQKVLEAKASGYAQLLTTCGANPELAPTLLMVEKIESIVKEQVKAIQNLKIDKITVWDSGQGGSNGEGPTSTAGFLRGLIGSLPPMHELAKQAGVELPPILGTIADDGRAASEGHSGKRASAPSPRPNPTQEKPESQS